jgi:hypothetical protein
VGCSGFSVISRWERAPPSITRIRQPCRNTNSLILKCCTDSATRDEERPKRRSRSRQRYCFDERGPSRRSA